MKYRSLFLMLLCSTLLLTSCGFHLRGIHGLPAWLNNVAIVIEDAHRDLEPLLTTQLQGYSLRVNPDPATATYWLIMEQDTTRQQISSISSSTTPRQYQLIYSLRFKLTRAKGKEILPSSTVVVTRLLTVNSDRILGSNFEEETLKREMRMDAVVQVLDRIGAQHAH